MPTAGSAREPVTAADRAAAGDVATMPGVTPLPLPESAFLPGARIATPSAPLPTPARPRWRTARRAIKPSSGRPRILMTTEATYPYAVGGVSSWCDLLIDGLTEFDWQILPIIAGERGAVQNLRAAPARRARRPGRTVVRAPSAVAFLDARRPRRAREPAREPGSRADRMGGQLRGAAGRADRGAGAGPTPCAAPSVAPVAGACSSARWRRCSTSATPTAAPRRT